VVNGDEYIVGMDTWRIGGYNCRSETGGESEGGDGFDMVVGGGKRGAC
jgi:hypothetical protein